MASMSTVSSPTLRFVWPMVSVAAPGVMGNCAMAVVQPVIQFTVVKTVTPL